MKVVPFSQLCVEPTIAIQKSLFIALLKDHDYIYGTSLTFQHWLIAEAQDGTVNVNTKVYEYLMNEANPPPLI